MQQSKRSTGPFGAIIIIFVVTVVTYYVGDAIRQRFVRPEPWLRVNTYDKGKLINTREYRNPPQPCSAQVREGCMGPVLTPTDAERTRWEKLKQEGNQ